MLLGFGEIRPYLADDDIGELRGEGHGKGISLDIVDIVLFLGKERIAAGVLLCHELWLELLTVHGATYNIWWVFGNLGLDVHVLYHMDILVLIVVGDLSTECIGDILSEHGYLKILTIDILVSYQVSHGDFIHILGMGFVKENPRLSIVSDNAFYEHSLMILVKLQGVIEKKLVPISWDHFFGQF